MFNKASLVEETIFGKQIHDDAHINFYAHHPRTVNYFADKDFSSL